MIYYDKNGKRIRAGMGLWYSDDGETGCFEPVVRKDRELGIIDTFSNKFIPLSDTRLETAEARVIKNAETI